MALWTSSGSSLFFRSLKNFSPRLIHRFLQLLRKQGRISKQLNILIWNKVNEVSKNKNLMTFRHGWAQMHTLMCIIFRMNWRKYHNRINTNCLCVLMNVHKDAHRWSRYQWIQNFYRIQVDNNKRFCASKKKSRTTYANTFVIHCLFYTFRVWINQNGLETKKKVIFRVVWRNSADCKWSTSNIRQSACCKVCKA